jgi:hypothetical protein
VASITRRATAAGDARYDVRLRIGGRVVTRTFKRRQDAERWAALTEADRAMGGAVDPRAGAVHLCDYFEARPIARIGRGRRRRCRPQAGAGLPAPLTL